MEFTGERYVPQVGGQIKYEHLHRYALAAGFAAGKSVLDVASGEGYGAALLARVASSVVGVDISSESVEHAARAYYMQNLEFLVGGCEALPLADSSVEVITSFETIEHHERHEEMMSEFKRVLKPGGVLVISSPNKLVYSDELNYQNPYHVRELYFDEFRRLLGRYFKHVHIYGQRLALGSFIYQLQGAYAQHYQSFSGDFEHLSRAVTNLPSPVYFVAVCSDEPLPDPYVGNSVYLDAADDLLKPPPTTEAPAETPEQALVRELEEQLAALGGQLRDAEQRVSERDALIEERAREAEELGRQLRDAEQREQEARHEAAESARRFEAERESLLAERAKLLAERESLVRDREEQLREKNLRAAELTQKLQQAEAQLRLKQRLEEELSRKLYDTEEQLRAKNAHAAEIENYLREKLSELAGKERLLQSYVRTVEDFGHSGSYRLGRALTWPLRFARRQLGPSPNGARPTGIAPQTGDSGETSDDPGDKEADTRRVATSAAPSRIESSESSFVASRARPQSPSRHAEEQLDPLFFDEEWYLSHSPDVAASGMSPFQHYLRHGAKEGRSPHPLFDAAWYLEQNPEVAEAGMSPLEHYLRHGFKEGLTPHPAFDPKFYRKTYPDSCVVSPDPLRSYLTEGWKKGHKPNPRFDPEFYLSVYPDIAEAGVEPFTHFITSGLREGRVGGPEDVSFEPFEPAFEIPREPVNAAEPFDAAVKAISFYLPQFHPIPENDAWWGEGFTEWTNVRKGEPMFEGHYQPHVPSTLGYYDLREPGVLERQVRLARESGIHGFCFYYYWFAGKVLLDLPLRRILETGKPDFPFCICWANENWTRRWDGREGEILVAQQHSPEDDLAFIRNVEPLLTHRNYIRVEGKPALLVYRPSLFPDAKATAERWREYFRARGHGELHLVTTRSFHDTTRPSVYGFDASVQFPPHMRVNPVTSLVRGRSQTFAGFIHDYNETKRLFVEELHNLNYHETMYPGVMPSWDNSARRGNKSSAWINGSPESYFDWLSKAVKFLRENRPPEERLVFINAWNEWAEGCHLEPDERFGHAWLNATRLALQTAGDDA